MNTIYAKASQLRLIDLNQISSFRDSVFIERLNWILSDAGAELEVDQFDRQSTYDVCVPDTSATGGYARLRPTAEPYFLSEVFLVRMGGALISMSSAVWKLSRFRAVDLHSPSKHRQLADFLRFGAGSVVPPCNAR
ncbi:acyl-homoserine-lactone synthase [Massilia frigida]|nr:acyl-homoserine-lactone synthase [Massilia frigida]